MAKIIVNSAPSFERGDVQDNPSHPGTNGDDIFIISPDSHGFPMANDDENRSGGEDTFRLSTDVDAKNKTPHPYQEGGGIVHIENFKIDDKIILPEEVPMNELLMLRYGYTKHPTTKNKPTLKREPTLFRPFRQSNSKDDRNELILLVRTRRNHLQQKRNG